MAQHHPQYAQAQPERYEENYGQPQNGPGATFHEHYNAETKWGTSGSGNGQFSGPTGVAVDGSGKVYVMDYSNNRVQKFDSSGTYLTKWGNYGSGDGQFQYAIGLAVDGGGTVYVADDSNQRIQKFDSGGAFLTKWEIGRAHV